MNWFFFKEENEFELEVTKSSPGFAESVQCTLCTLFLFCENLSCYLPCLEVHAVFRWKK